MSRPLEYEKGNSSENRDYHRGTGEHKDEGVGWKKGKGVKGIDWSDPDETRAHRQKIKSQQNSRSFEWAKNHREEWTDADLERIMDDDVTTIALSIELHRTVAGVHQAQRKVMNQMAQQLDTAFPFLRIDEPTRVVLAKMNKKACGALLSVWMERNPEADKDDALDEASEVISMMGLGELLGMGQDDEDYSEVSESDDEEREEGDTEEADEELSKTEPA